MNNTDKNLLHARILQVLRELGDKGRGEQLLVDDARMAGFELSLPELRSELWALADKAWIVSFSPPLGGTRYRITELGSSKLREQGL